MAKKNNKGSKPVAAKGSKPAAAAPAAAPAKGKTASGKPKRMTKAQVYAKLAEDTTLTKKQITDVFEKLTNLIKSQISPGSAEEIVIPPGLLKIRRAVRPPREEREGTNPKTREKIIIPAQPAKVVIKARVLKTLSEMAQ